MPTLADYTKLLMEFNADHPVSYYEQNPWDIGNGTAGYQAGPTGADYTQPQQYRDFLASLPDGGADYTAQDAERYAAATKKAKISFAVAVATMGIGAALAGVAAGTVAPAVAEGAAAGSVGGELTAGLSGSQIAALGEGIAGSTAGAQGLGGAFSGIAPGLFTGAGVVGSGAEGLLSNAAPEVFNAAKDSALASSQLGYTGAELGALPVSSPAITTTPVTGLLDTPAVNLTDLKTPGAVPSGPTPSSASTGLFSGLKDSASALLPAGTSLGDLGDLAKIGMGAYGAYEGSQKQPGETTTQKTTTDPRLDPYLYGDQGIFKQAQDWYGANKTGINANRQAGWDARIGLLTDPAIQAQIAKLKTGTQGLLSSPIAQNPFLKG